MGSTSHCLAILLLLGAASANNNQPPDVNGCIVQDSSVIESCCNLGYQYSKFGHIFYKPKVYTIANFCGNCQSVQDGYCDTVTDGGGWLVIQRRQDGSVDFNRDWVDYEDGFGSLTGEFWYGLRAIHCLTSHKQWELRIDYTFTNGSKGYLSYGNFRVGPATEQYPLTIAEFDGSTNNPLSYNNRMKFTTRDRDNDKATAMNNTFNCAVHEAGGRGGGWWYNACSYIALNRPYKYSYTVYFYGHNYALSFTEMKIRPKNCAT